MLDWLIAVSKSVYNRKYLVILVGLLMEHMCL